VVRFPGESAGEGAVEGTFEQLARALLGAVIRDAGLTFAADDTDRLVLELARYLAEGHAIETAVPAPLEPQTVAVFTRPGDET
jgi:hypothetical protein